jgi:Na+-transporting methylmalonyl-CoA/oxaloacetate decarboxylase beta subunit
MVEHTKTLENLKPEAVKNGIGLGLIALVLGILSAYLLVGAKSMMAIFLIPIGVGLIIPLVVAVLFCLDLRKKIGGFWTLRQATSGIFIMFLVTYAISNVGNVIFNKFIEKDMTERIQNTVVGATSSLMKNQGVDEEQVDKKVAEMNADFERKNQGTIMQTIQGHVIGMIIVFVIALLFGAVLKKELPLYINDN